MMTKRIALCGPAAVLILALSSPAFAADTPADALATLPHYAVGTSLDQHGKIQAVGLFDLFRWKSLFRPGEVVMLSAVAGPSGQGLALSTSLWREEVMGHESILFIGLAGLRDNTSGKAGAAAVLSLRVVAAKN